MPSYQTTGIVIGRTNFGEADRIVRFLTPDRGKLSAVAKGARKIKSRAAGHLELFSETNLVLATGRNLDVITSARLAWYPHQLAADFDRLGLAFAIATAVDRLTEPGQPQPKLYELVAEALRSVDTGATGALPELWFKLRLVNILGYQPQLASCIICGRHDTDTTYVFSIERGGIACSVDAGAGDIPFSGSLIKFWRILSSQPFKVVSGVSGGPDLAASSLPVCDAFYEHHLGRSFRPSNMGIGSS